MAVSDVDLWAQFASNLKKLEGIEPEQLIAIARPDEIYDLANTACGFTRIKCIRIRALAEMKRAMFDNRDDHSCLIGRSNGALGPRKIKLDGDECLGLNLYKGEFSTAALACDRLRYWLSIMPIDPKDGLESVYAPIAAKLTDMFDRADVQCAAVSLNPHTCTATVSIGFAPSGWTIA